MPEIWLAIIAGIIGAIGGPVVILLISILVSLLDLNEKKD